MKKFFEWEVTISIVVEEEGNYSGSTTNSICGNDINKKEVLKQLIPELIELLDNLENNNVFT